MSKLYRSILLTVAFIYLSASGFAQNTTSTYSFEGVYKGNDMYIDNPVCPKNPTEHCIHKIILNNKWEIKLMGGETIPIHFKEYAIQKGNKITLEITHKTGTEPKIINKGDF